MIFFKIWYIANIDPCIQGDFALKQKKGEDHAHSNQATHRLGCRDCPPPVLGGERRERDSATTLLRLVQPRDQLPGQGLQVRRPRWLHGRERGNSVHARRARGGALPAAHRERDRRIHRVPLPALCGADARVGLHEGAPGHGLLALARHHRAGAAHRAADLTAFHRIAANEGHGLLAVARDAARVPRALHGAVHPGDGRHGPRRDLAHLRERLHEGRACPLGHGVRDQDVPGTPAGRLPTKPEAALASTRHRCRRRRPVSRLVHLASGGCSPVHLHELRRHRHPDVPRRAPRAPIIRIPLLRRPGHRSVRCTVEAHSVGHDHLLGRSLDRYNALWQAGRRTHPARRGTAPAAAREQARLGGALLRHASGDRTTRESVVQRQAEAEVPRGARGDDARPLAPGIPPGAEAGRAAGERGLVPHHGAALPRAKTARGPGAPLLVRQAAELWHAARAEATGLAAAHYADLHPTPRWCGWPSDACSAGA